jgi:hypothetical protein
VQNLFAKKTVSALALMVLILVVFISGCTGPETYSVRGTVKEANGQGLSGVNLLFSGGFGTATTNSEGHWSKTDLSGMVTVTPEKWGYTFSPGNIELPQTTTTNFTATYTVSGYVRDATKDHVGLPGIEMHFGEDYAPVTTDSQGCWIRSGLSGTVTITPVSDQYVFDPPSYQVSNPYFNDIFKAREKQQKIATREIEPNNEWTTANKIAVNETYTGNLETGNDIDFYKFTLPSAGSIVIRFSHELFDDNGEFWGITLVDDTTLDNVYSFASRGKSANAKSSTIRLPEGDYYIKIARGHFSDMDYNLCVSYTEEGDAFEKEFNNSFSDATPILTNTKYTGNLFKRDDADYYKFTLQSSGSIMIQFSHELFDDGRNFWNITLLDDTTSNTIYSFASRGKPADTDSSTIQLPAGDYYVKISHDDFHSMDHNILVEIVE